MDEKEKGPKVKKLFDDVSQNYDLLNDLMSFGIQRQWKKEFIESLAPFTGLTCIDVAGGTGDIAAKIVEMQSKEGKIIKANIGDQDGQQYLNDDFRVTVFDKSEQMMHIGREKLSKDPLYQKILWKCGDAENLPFDDCTFDLYTISFGIRNVTRIDQAIREAFRVLKPYGRFACLEFSNVDNIVIENFYRQYLKMIPVLGELVNNDWKSYQYLKESIERFHSAPELANLIEANGFRHVNFKKLLFGVVAIHSGFKMPT